MTTCPCPDLVAAIHDLATSIDVLTNELRQSRLARQEDIEALVEARRRTQCLVDDLDDGQLHVPHLDIVNPILWEIGHVAWFHEKWLLRHLRGRPSLRVESDRLFDSAAVEHDDRWDLPMYTRPGILTYMAEVQGASLEALSGPHLEQDLYFARLVLAHEDMHGEALTYTRQTLGYRVPAPGCPSTSVTDEVIESGSPPEASSSGRRSSRKASKDSQADGLWTWSSVPRLRTLPERSGSQRPRMAACVQVLAAPSDEGWSSLPSSFVGLPS